MNRQQYAVLKLKIRVINIFTLVMTLGASVYLYADQVCQTNDIDVTSPTSRYIQHANGTVTDSQTDLMWHVCLTDKNNEVNKSQCSISTSYTWGEALDYVVLVNSQIKFAGYADWRLPNIRELATLAELQCFRPAINLAVFPDTLPVHYWSSSPYKFYPHYSWYMNFEDGVYTYGDRTDKKYIRLVRDTRS